MMRLLCMLGLLAACSAPAQIRDLQEAENHEHAGRNEAALRAYQAAQRSCKAITKARRRREACTAAHLQRAELLVTMERESEAIEAYHQAEAELAKIGPSAAQACYSAALLYLKRGDLEPAYKYFWRTITNYPNEAFAADAIKRLLRDGRRRAPEQLRTEVERLSSAMAGTKIADNLLAAAADLSEHEMNEPRAALAFYDLLVKRYPKSGFFDDSLWHGARLSRSLGAPKAAVLRLRKLVATREVAFGAGSYFSIWLDNAQLELGRVLRDDLKQNSAAITAFAQLPKDYPHSILRDDALYEKAFTRGLAGQQVKACRDLSKLRKKYPDSKYELSDAPKLRSQLGCPL